MSYTNVDQVRNHLGVNSSLLERVSDRPVQLGDSAIRFHNGPIAAGSLGVKSIRSVNQERNSIAAATGGVTFSSSPVVPGSVVVASDSSLGVLFAESQDYLVDYAVGKLTPKSGGTLPPGDPVTVWFLPYTVLVAGEDYQCDYDNAEIRRLSGGSIGTGETVFLDYSPVYADVTDQILLSAVAEANGLIEREIDPEGEFGADATLGLAATYRALEIVCRTSASRELASLRAEDRVAAVWLKLAEEYGRKADKLLSGFRPPLAGPSTPVKT